MNPALADFNDVFSASQPARRDAADLDVRLLSHRLQLKHGVERRNFQRPDVGHLQQVGDGTDRRFRNPARMLLLHTPQNWNHRGGLPARRKLCDLLLGPSEIFR